MLEAGNLLPASGQYWLGQWLTRASGHRLSDMKRVDWRGKWGKIMVYWSLPDLEQTVNCVIVQVRQMNHCFICRTCKDRYADNYRSRLIIT